MDIKEHKHELDATLRGPLFQDVGEGDPYVGQIATWVQDCKHPDCGYIEVVGQGIPYRNRYGQGRFVAKSGDFVFPAPE